jgi:hypothetical protein
LTSHWIYNGERQAVCLPETENTGNMAFPSGPTASAGKLPSYYEDLGDDNVRHSFRDFDAKPNFDLFDAQMRDHRSSNFCLDFGEDSAYCAFDLDTQSYKKLLTSPRPGDLHTRWINIWMPYKQKDLIRMLARQFDFTPRLQGVMQSDPLPPRDSASLRSQKSSATLGSKFSFRSQKLRKSNSTKGAKEASDAPADSEENIGMTDIMHTAQLEMVQDLGHYQLVDDVWHWSTVDQGRRCEL